MVRKGEPRKESLTERQKLLLAFLSAGDEFLSPLRIMKGLFLIVQKRGTLLPKDALYTFQPYLFGPFTPDLYQDLAHLVNERLVEWKPLPYASWAIYRASPTGKEVAKGILRHYPKELTSYIQRVWQRVATTPVADLLAAIYRNFPDYAIFSIAQHQKRGG
jgi:uncharacterized protein YwgA